MLSIPDLAIVGVFALLVFGPDKLPGVMRKAGHVMRDIQNTSQGFIREMERAADVSEPQKPWAPPEHPEDHAYPMHGYGASSNGDVLHGPTAEELESIALPHAEMLPLADHASAVSPDHAPALHLPTDTIAAAHPESDHAPVAMQHELAPDPQTVTDATLHPGKPTPETDHSANI